RRLRGKTSPAKTDRGYELRSQGPATLGPDALDNLVSASRRSSSSSAPPPQPTTASASLSNPPTSPPSAAASATSTMSEPTTADLAKMIETLTTTVMNLQTIVTALQKEKSASSLGTGGGNDVRSIDLHQSLRIVLPSAADHGGGEGLDGLLQLGGRRTDVVRLVQANEGTSSWRRFTELLNLRYGPPLRSAPLAELAECRRTGTVVEYQDRFQALLPRAGPLRESQRVQLFTGGLQPPLSIDVRIQNPQSLAAAMSLARQFELREQYAAPAPRAPPRPLLPAPPPRLALPVLPGPRAATPAMISVKGRQIKHLTQAEQKERRRKGLCYNCDEKYTRGYNRVCQRLFLLEGIEEDDADGPTEESEEAAAEDAPVFTLQALAGVSFANTMQVAVALGSVALVALLDSGSTHNFISEAAARRSGLPLQ
ncbi:hypothetical protein U9M48_042838, partial [Paspalum notatum var. saurae]